MLQPQWSRPRLGSMATTIKNRRAAREGIWEGGGKRAKASKHGMRKMTTRKDKEPKMFGKHRTNRSLKCMNFESEKKEMTAVAEIGRNRY